MLQITLSHMKAIMIYFGMRIIGKAYVMLAMRISTNKIDGRVNNMGKLIDSDNWQDYFRHYMTSKYSRPVAILDDINKTVQTREGFCAGLAFYSEKIPYDLYGERFGK